MSRVPGGNALEWAAEARWRCVRRAASAPMSMSEIPAPTQAAPRAGAKTARSYAPGTSTMQKPNYVNACPLFANNVTGKLRTAGLHVLPPEKPRFGRSFLAIFVCYLQSLHLPPVMVTQFRGLQSKILWIKIIGAIILQAKAHCRMI